MIISVSLLCVLGRCVAGQCVRDSVSGRVVVHMKCVWVGGGMMRGMSADGCALCVCARRWVVHTV